MKVGSVPASIALVLAILMGGCGGGGGSGTGEANATPSSGGTTFLRVQVQDVLGSPLAEAVVRMTATGWEQERTTDASGLADFNDLPSGTLTVSVSAAGFEPYSLATSFERGRQFTDITLNAEGAWAVGRPIVLGTEQLDRESDGSAISFSVDMALIDEYGQALETLTSTDFSATTIDCGWGGPRDCASDEEGNATGSFLLDADGAAQNFEYVPAPARHPYLVAVVVERSRDVCSTWAERVSGLNAFFSLIGGNDAASLMTVQTESGTSTLTVHGSFTNDGSMFLDTVDSLDCSDGSPPQLFDRLAEAIELVAAADGLGIPDAERHLVVVAMAGLTASEVRSLAELARDADVHISSVPGQTASYYQGLPEVAVRTGGFVSFINDGLWRDSNLVFEALDLGLSGELPAYRMHFRLIGEEGTFVSGGNVMVHLRVDVPTPLPHRGVSASADVPTL